MSSRPNVLVLEALDTLKARAPIWKKEHYEGGAVWIGQGS